MRMIALLGLVTLLAACTPADQEYCNGFGVNGTAEYAKCMSYYHQQEAAFNADRAVCDTQADQTYPRSLYDYGRYQPTFYGGRGFGAWPYGYGGMSTMYVEPDYYRNQQVDQLRMRIVQPCMEARGWNSGESWQAGRRTVVKKKAPKAMAPRSDEPRGNAMNALPWLH